MLSNKFAQAPRHEFTAYIAFWVSSFRTRAGQGGGFKLEGRHPSVRIHTASRAVLPENGAPGMLHLIFMDIEKPQLLVLRSEQSLSHRCPRKGREHPG